MKILVMGDIHGRLIWHDICNKHPDVDRIVFLGDYVTTHDDISSEQQLSNLEDILNFKEGNSDKVILLRGNHDLQELGYSWAECSGFDKKVWRGMKSMKDKFEKLTQWVYIQDNLLFSHAGISQVWLDLVGLTVDMLNEQPPSDKFAFNGYPWDFYGNSETQPLTWIRPASLARCAVKGYIQIVGHTPVSKTIFNVRERVKDSENIWLCDALNLKQYLLIENNNFKICTYEG